MLGKRIILKFNHQHNNRNSSSNNTDNCKEDNFGNCTEGYSVLLVDTLPEKLRCPLCKNLMRNPIQTYRGELACKRCYQQRKWNSKKCPVDGEPISAEEIFNDKAKSLEIFNLQCCCLYQIHGCLWQGTVGTVEEHQSSCAFMPETCSLCNGDIIHGKPQDHFTVCPRLLDQKECFFKSEGCDYKSVNQGDLMKHLKEETATHGILCKALMDHINTENIALRKQIDDHQSYVANIEERYKKEIEALVQRISSLENDLKKMQTDLLRYVKGSEEKTNQNEKFVNTKTTTLTHTKETGGTKDFENLAANLSVLSSNVGDLDLRQQILENTTYDGRILWKIDRVSTRLQQAITGKVTALHSAPGFTSKYGYKFCVRLYMNGDGMGKCTHLSIFIVVMKSEYDNLLQWPFHRRVTFRLINQVDQSKNVTESFYPDVNSSSFQKPVKEMNVAAGCPLFLQKEELMNSGFVKDDSIFVELITF